ncbi:MAG: electron transport complex subunit RsxB [Pseudomonadales bacterium]|nr:electron transport complex subunit RsxB [Pseudomonadales bacterium]
MIEFLLSNPLLAALVALGGLALVFGAVLGYASIKFKVEGNPIVDQINELLPQTQCGQCGFPGCKPYAEAIANGEEINRCPPGGEATVQTLADLLDVEATPLDAVERPPSYAYIREDECIGCTKCIQACPMDAILGAAKQMHTVITDECTGCDLCVEPCPVDCIDMIPIPTTMQSWSWDLPQTPGQKHNDEDLIATDLKGEVA